MATIALALLGQIWPYLLAGGVALGGLWTAYVKGKASEKAKQVAADAKAANEARKIDDAVSGASPDANRKELGEWSKS